jgi:polar amino acid transport system substrate-binding protein
MFKNKVLYIFFALILLSVLGYWFYNNNNKPIQTASKPQLFYNNSINVGFISYPPGFIVDPNTKEKSGIFNDILLEIAKRNNLLINYKEEVTWATMIEALKTDRVNLIANPVWATPERKENADFSKPVYFSPIGVFVRADDNRFDTDRTKLNDPKIKIAAVDGEINYSIGKQDFPLAEVKPFPNNIDVAQLFLEIQTKKKDVTFAEPMFAYDYMQKNPGKLKNIGEKAPIRNYPNCFMYKKGESKVGNFLNTEIDKLLKDGTIDKIIAKYAPFKGAVISATDSLAVDIQ